MKSKKKLLSLLILAVIASFLLAVPAFAKPKLNRKSVTIQKGKTVKLKVKGAEWCLDTHISRESLQALMPAISKWQTLTAPTSIFEYQGSGERRITVITSGISRCQSARDPVCESKAIFA